LGLFALAFFSLLLLTLGFFLQGGHTLILAQFILFVLKSLNIILV
jgi:hypothetical protein